ncbi:MAG: patatin-like phospholipase family protein, partial [Rhodoplanes sp.]
SSLLSEYRAIEFVARLIEQQRLPHGTGPGQYRLIKLHRIVLDGSGQGYSADIKLPNDYDFFALMRTRGAQAARRFLDAHFGDVNVKSTVDLTAEAHAEWA